MNAERNKRKYRFRLQLCSSERRELGIFPVVHVCESIQMEFPFCAPIADSSRMMHRRAPLRPSYRLNRSESVFFFVPFCRWHYFLILIRRTLRITRSNVNDIETHIQVVPHAEIKTKRKCHEALLCENSTRSTTNNSCREEMRARAHTRKSILLQMTR